MRRGDVQAAPPCPTHLGGLPPALLHLGHAQLRGRQGGVRLCRFLLRLLKPGGEVVRLALHLTLSLLRHLGGLQRICRGSRGERQRNRNALRPAAMWCTPAEHNVESLACVCRRRAPTPRPASPTWAASRRASSSAALSAASPSARRWRSAAAARSDACSAVSSSAARSSSRSRSLMATRSCASKWAACTRAAARHQARTVTTCSLSHTHTHTPPRFLLRHKLQSGGWPAGWLAAATHTAWHRLPVAQAPRPSQGA